MTVGEALAEGVALLRDAGVDSPSLDASLLLAAAMDIDRARLFARRPDSVPQYAYNRYKGFLSHRIAGDCVAYVLGRKEFRGLDFEVSPAVLVPRPDTEILVEAALVWIDENWNNKPEKDIHVLDVCAGSGCIAIAIKNERPSTKVEACDLSRTALEIARRNAARLLGPQAGNESPTGKDAQHNDGLIRFFESDLFSRVPGRFNLIVSNPPYIPSGDIDGLAKEVRGEPRMALDGGPDGLTIIRALITEARGHLDDGGRILIESGAEQVPLVAELLRANGFIEIARYRDLAGLERVTGGTWLKRTEPPRTEGQSCHE